MVSLTFGWIGDAHWANINSASVLGVARSCLVKTLACKGTISCSSVIPETFSFLDVC